MILEICSLAIPKSHHDNGIWERVADTAACIRCLLKRVVSFSLDPQHLLSLSLSLYLCDRMYGADVLIAS